MTLARLRVRSVWAALTALVIVLTGMGVVLLPAAPAAATSAPATSAPTTKAPTPSTPATKAPAASAHAAAPVSLSCEPGNVYSASAGGQLRKVTSSESSNVGDSATKQERYGTIFGWRYRDVPVTSFNGLGIGKNGAPIFAYERTDSAQTVEIYQFDATSESWKTTGATATKSGVQFIGGAVNLSTDVFYFGGFNTSGTSFSLYSYDSANARTSFKGTVDTSADSGGAANGDMAFDANGNLFIVRGSGSTTTVFSVTAANLENASGGKIISAKSAGFSTNSNVNGVAFDTGGKAYLGTGNTITSYDMPNWSNKKTFASDSNWGSTDLASCSAPVTITLKKDVQGGRAKAGDQFGLSLKQGGTELGSTTTTGDSIDVQDEIVGPLPAKRGAALTFSESAANGANLGDYASAYSCTVDDKAISGASGTGTSGTVTIPNSGKEVVCTITNSPLTANVSIHKDVADENGEDKKPGKDWTFGAKATATTNSVTATPSAATQKTDANGDAKWALKFDKATGRATVAVSETQQDGFEFKSADCTITGLDGTKTEKTITSEKATDLTGIKPGDDVECSYLNKVKDTQLTLKKVVDNKDAAGTAKETDWTLKAVGDKDSGSKTIEGKTGSKNVTKVKVKAGKYALSESGGPEGYEASDWVCKPTAGTGQVTSDKGSATLKAGDDVTCTITNTAKTGTVTWQKSDESGNALEGSVWTLQGPGGSALEIEDCSAASADKCAGPDKDPAAGKFLVNGLKWGKYSLVEESAPAGYILDDAEHTFTVSGEKLTKKFDEPFVNAQKPPVALPLTGGTGSQIFVIGGAALCAAGGVGALLKGLRRRNRKH